MLNWLFKELKTAKNSNINDNSEIYLESNQNLILHNANKIIENNEKFHKKQNEINLGIEKEINLAINKDLPINSFLLQEKGKIVSNKECLLLLDKQMEII